MLCNDFIPGLIGWRKKNERRKSPNAFRQLCYLFWPVYSFFTLQEELFLILNVCVYEFEVQTLIVDRCVSTTISVECNSFFFSNRMLLTDKFSFRSIKKNIYFFFFKFCYVTAGVIWWTVMSSKFKEEKQWF